MKKLLFIIVFAFAFLNLTKANVTEVNVPIVMTQIIDNPTEEHGESPKSPEATLLVYQNGNTIYFGESLAGCVVTLLLNNVVVYTDCVGADGIISIPASISGTFVLCINVGSQIFSAEIEL